MDALNKIGCEQIFTDQGVSGATLSRKDYLWQLPQSGQVTCWTAWTDHCELIGKLRDEGAGFESLSDGINTTRAGGKLVFHIMGALVEFERSLISERSKAEMQAARRRGKHIGWPHKLNREQVSHTKQMIQEGRETVAGMAGLLSVDRTTLYRALSRR